MLVEGEDVHEGVEHARAERRIARDDSLRAAIFRKGG